MMLTILWLFLHACAPAAIDVSDVDDSPLGNVIVLLVSPSYIPCSIVVALL